MFGMTGIIHFQLSRGRPDMVYVDSLKKCKKTKRLHYTQSCHLVADNDRELLAFGLRIGLKRSWMQFSRTGITHFDLNKAKREQSLLYGAKPITVRQLVRMIRIFKNLKKLGVM